VAAHKDVRHLEDALHLLPSRTIPLLSGLFWMVGTVIFWGCFVGGP